MNSRLALLAPGPSVLAVIVTVNLGLALLLAWLELARGVDHWNLVTDANTLAGQPRWFGAYSYLGILLWAVGAAVALFAASVLGREAHERGVRTVLLAGGAYMALACLDDLFILHEYAGKVAGLEKLALLAHGLAFAGVLWLAWRVRSRTPWMLMAACAAAFALTTAADVIPHVAPGQVLVEEVLKLLGISCLAAYMVFTARRALTHP